MPRNPTVTIPAPQGMNNSALPALLPPGRCPRLTNLRPDRAGRLRGSLKVTDVASLAASADGISFYYGEEVTDDRLLIVANGMLYAGRPIGTADAPQWDMFAVGIGFEVGKPVRSAHYAGETFFVQDGGIAPLRYDGTGLYQLGITPPARAPFVLPRTPSGGVTDNKTGTIYYGYTYFDSRARESDLSPMASINYTANTGYCGDIGIEYGDDPQVVGAYIYATVAGSTAVKYRIGTLYKAKGETHLEDNLADATVSAAGATQAPSPGQFAIPNPASVIAVHKRHIVLNDVTDGRILQINAIDAPTHWSSVTYSAADGTRLSIGTHQGAGINALEPIGTLLMVSTRAEILQLWGDAPSGGSPFELRALHSMGILAPSSFKWCGNVAVGLMADGKVWATGGADNFLAHELSADIETSLREHTATELEAAQADFLENTYILAIGDRFYFYDFTAGGWYTAEGLTTAPLFVPLSGGGLVDANAPDFGGVSSMMGATNAVVTPTV